MHIYLLYRSPVFDIEKPINARIRTPAGLPLISLNNALSKGTIEEGSNGAETALRTLPTIRRLR